MPRLECWVKRRLKVAVKYKIEIDKAAERMVWHLAINYLSLLFMKFIQPVADTGFVDAKFPNYLWNHFQYKHANVPVETSENCQKLR